MWPFRKKRPDGDDVGAIIDRAIAFAAERWLIFTRAVVLDPETALRDRIGIFARSIDASLHARFPALVAAPDEVMLLIVAKGVEQSGTVTRSEVERALGILLPP